MTNVLVNDEIPRTMTRAGLEYLGKLARTVPKNGTIVEVGPLFGSSTWVLAMNADPSVRVISIDTWEPQQWIDAIEAKFPGCKSFSKDAFDYYTRDCPNVTAVQGFSPDVMKDWNEPIDIFFDDATHGNPGFKNNLDFFLPKLRDGGIACGDDFASGWPDIVTTVGALGKEWGMKPEIIGRLWAIVKPAPGKTGPSVYSKAGPYSEYDLAISVRMADGQTIDCAPGTWAGNLHETNCISAVRINWAKPRKDNLTGVYALQGKGSQSCSWVPFGEWAEEPEPIRFAAHLIGRTDLKLSYQTCCVVRGKRNHNYTRNTKSFRDAAWTVLESKPTAQRPEPGPMMISGLAALRCFVSHGSAVSDD